MKKLKLENYNFRVDSKDWLIDKGGVKTSPTDDIWEFEGEQLFTWDAAMRETKKAGKRMPTDSEFSKIIKTKEDIENLVFTGYRSTNGTFYDYGTYTHFWSSSESDTSAWICSLYKFNHTIHRNDYYKVHGFSVRCIQD